MYIKTFLMCYLPYEVYVAQTFFGNWHVEQQSNLPFKFIAVKTKEDLKKQIFEVYVMIREIKTLFVCTDMPI